MGSLKNAWKNKPMIIILSGLLLLAIIGVLAAVIYRGIMSRNGGGTGTTPVTPSEVAAQPTDEGGEATSTATKVVSSPSPSPTPGNTPAPKPTQLPTSTPQPVVTPTVQPQPTQPAIANVLNNGGFEWGFAEDGTPKGWQRFDNGGAAFIFAPEQWDLGVRNGDYAQRITIVDAHQADRYAGVWQTVAVVPGESYKLLMYGQIRSKLGDITKSHYGYRMQYAVDWTGGTDWQTIPADEWIELPWDEQLIDGAGVRFVKFTATLVPPEDQLTLFVRAWSKWPDGLEAQYTLDTLSLTGSPPAESLPDQPLPNTGGREKSLLPADPRVWGSLVFLLLLLSGAWWRYKYLQP